MEEQVKIHRAPEQTQAPKKTPWPMVVIVMVAIPASAIPWRNLLGWMVGLVEAANDYAKGLFDRIFTFHTVALMLLFMILFRCCRAAPNPEGPEGETVRPMAAPIRRPRLSQASSVLTAHANNRRAPRNQLPLTPGTAYISPLH